MPVEGPILAISVIIACLILITFAFIVFRQSSGKDEAWKHQRRKQIYQVKQRTNENNQDMLWRSILDYDKLLDHILKDKGALGLTLGDRLKNSGKMFSNRERYNDAWSLHKLRNQMAHEFDLKLSISELREASSQYYQLLLDLLNS